MYRHFFVALCLAATASTAACAADTDDEGADATQDEVRVSDVQRFQIRQSTGFVPPSAPGTCRPSGQWNVDMVNRKLQGQGCVDSVPTTVDRRITTAELSSIRTALFKVKSARRPDACPTDAPVRSLDVFRKTWEDHYIEQRSACGSAIPVTSESIGALMDLVTEIAGAEDKTAAE